MLSVENVTKDFGGLRALESVDVTLKSGETLGIVGPNGSGKTTLLNIVTGVYRPTSGRILFQGQDITGLKCHVIARNGISRTFQNLRLYPTLTVFENVRAAQHTGSGGLILGLINGSRNRRTRSALRIEDALELAGLARQRDVLAANLPLPARRRLEIARVLAAGPELILLDEPAGGMTPAETDEMAELIRKAVAPGRGCIVIEHKMDLITKVCDRLCVLDFGRKIAEGRPGKVLRDPAVQQAYLGRNGGQDA